MRIIKKNFECNNDYSLIYSSEYNRYLVGRDYVNQDTVYFDPANDFAPIIDRDYKYISKKFRRLITKEIKEYDPEIYNTIFGENVKVENEMSDELLETMKAIQLQMSKNPYEDAIVEAIISKGKEISTENILTDLKLKLDEFITQEYGSIPKKLTVTTEISTKDIVGLLHYQFEKIIKFVSANVPIMLVGPAGSGKNHTLEQVSEALDLNFYFSNAITQEYKLTGFIDANGTYHETQFYKAFTNGGIFFLDEIDASIPEVLLILNSAIANKYFDFPIGKVVAHENFRVVSAGNTIGQGADNQYVGRTQLDAASLDRFAVIEFDYDSNVEEQLAVTPQLFEFIQSARYSIKKLSMRHVISMRATIDSSKMYNLIDLEDILQMIIFKGLSKEDLMMIEYNLECSNDNEFYRSLKEMIK